NPAGGNPAGGNPVGGGLGGKLLHSGALLHHLALLAPALRTGLGSPAMQTLSVGNGQQPLPGQPGAGTVSPSNPYAAALPGVKAPLFVDGKPVQTKTMGAMLPRQSRSLMFSGVTFPTAGKHDFKVQVDSGTARRTTTTQLTAQALVGTPQA